MTFTDPTGLQVRKEDEDGSHDKLPTIGVLSVDETKEPTINELRTNNALVVALLIPGGNLTLDIVESTIDGAGFAFGILTNQDNPDDTKTGVYGREYEYGERQKAGFGFVGDVALTALTLGAESVAKNLAKKAVQTEAEVLQAVGSTPTQVMKGEFVNRVFDSRYGIVEGVSTPKGMSFSPGSGVPTTASEAIIDRGLMIYNTNNAERCVVYQAMENIPAQARTCLQGTAPEVLIKSQFFDSLKKICEYPLVK